MIQVMLLKSLVQVCNEALPYYLIRVFLKCGFKAADISSGTTESGLSAFLVYFLILRQKVI